MVTMEGASGVGHCKRVHIKSTYAILLLGLFLSVFSPFPSINAQILTGNESVKLLWIATGDDGNLGRANRYEVRVALQPIDSTNWVDAVDIPNTPKPAAPGTTDSVIIDGIEPGVTYYAAVRIADEVPNWSRLSASVEIFVPDTTTTDTTTVATPDFAADITHGATPLSVGFTNLTPETPLGWRWDFGDGATSTATSPSHTYDTPGTYTVSLTAFWSADTTTTTKVDYIAAVPVPQFSATPTYGIAPLAVDFTNLTSETPLGWRWDFGDGTTSTATNPSHTYDTPGTYTVTLTAFWSSDTTSLTLSDLILVEDLSSNTSEVLVPQSELTNQGSVIGTYADLAQLDGSMQQLTETESGGKPELRHSELDHTWTLDVPSSQTLSFHVWAGRADNSDNDDFLFEYSANGEPFRSLVAVTAPTLTHYEAFMPTDVSGSVTIRVVDTDRSQGNRSLDAVRIDQLYIESGGSSVSPDTVYVAWIQTGQSSEPSLKFHAQAIVCVESSAGFPASGVDVYGHFEGIVNGKSVEVTASNGEAEFLSEKTRSLEGNWTFYVDSLGANGRIYSSGLNLTSNASGRFDPDLLPSSTELYTNYPNPFNPTTTIEFWLPQPGEVRLSIYNVLGQEIEVLFDNESLPTGTHTVQWDGNRFASGVYFYRLESADAVETRKMMLLK